MGTRSDVAALPEDFDGAVGFGLCGLVVEDGARAADAGVAVRPMLGDGLVPDVELMEVRRQEQCYARYCCCCCGCDRVQLPGAVAVALLLLAAGSLMD